MIARLLVALIFITHCNDINAQDSSNFELEFAVPEPYAEEAFKPEVESSESDSSIETIYVEEVSDSKLAPPKLNSSLDSGCKLQRRHYDLAFRSSYFYPQESLNRRIYNGFRYDLQLDLSFPLRGPLYAFSNLAYYRKNGHSIGLNNPTTIKLYPLTLGVKYLCSPRSCLDLYGGLGLSYTWMRLYDDATLLDKHVNKQYFGLTVVSGINYWICKRIFLNVFLDYLFISSNLKNCNDLGGLKAGIGIGTRF